MKRFLFLKLAVILLLSFCYSVFAQSDIIFQEDFEDDSLDAQITIQTVGSFNSLPDIRTTENFGSQKAFGFGRSTCGFNCFESFMTKMIITFDLPVYIDSLNFNEMEIYGNWGNKGKIYINGVYLEDSYFGRSPSNDRKADTVFRHRNYVIDTIVNTIEIRVWDITKESEILIDDINVFLGTTGVNGYDNNPEYYFVNIYPNPTNGKINMDIITNSVGFVKGDITVFDYHGRVLHSMPINRSGGTTTENLDMTSYSKGIYFIKTTIDGKDIFRRIVKVE